jgi:hypothetical protein
VTPTEVILLMCIPYMGLLMLATGLFTAWSSVNRHLIRQGLAEQLPKEVRWKSRDEIADEVIAERAKQRQEICPGWDGQAELLGELFRAQHPVVCGDKVERWSETND